MEIAIDSPGFEGRGLKYQTRGLIAGAKIIIDGNSVQRQKQGYLVRNNNGEDVTIKLKSKLAFIDPVQKIEVDGKEINLAPPLQWYQYIWMCIPILLVVAGGVLGAVCGVVAAYISADVFRSNMSPVWKYVVTGCITIGAGVVYFLAAILFFFLTRSY
jgi:hypothetical protein